MLLENFKFIFSFLVRSCSPSELEKALGYVQVSVNSVPFFFERKGGESRPDREFGEKAGVIGRLGIVLSVFLLK